jgi:hypothetical protein
VLKAGIVQRVSYIGRRKRRIHREWHRCIIEFVCGIGMSHLASEQEPPVSIERIMEDRQTTEME